MPRCKNTYALPMKQKDFTGWSKKKSPAHVDKLRHSVDFYCAEGTKVYAARAGVVVYVKDDSSIGGPDKKYWDDGNRIVIKHDNDEYTAYEHLQYRGSVVMPGQQVRRGQLIGFNGNTGFSFGPHLHFEVFTNPDEDEIEGETLQVFFDELKR